MYHNVSCIMYWTCRVVWLIKFTKTVFTSAVVVNVWKVFTQSQMKQIMSLFHT